MRHGNGVDQHLRLVEVFVDALKRTPSTSPVKQMIHEPEDDAYDDARRTLRTWKQLLTSEGADLATEALKVAVAEIERMHMPEGSEAAAKTALGGLLCWGLEKPYAGAARRVLQPFDSIFDAERAFDERV